jgi:hypothetical protein
LLTGQKIVALSYNCNEAVIKLSRSSLILASVFDH